MDDRPDYIGIYSIDAEIGSGGSARVFKAYDKRLLRWVAIKVLYDYQQQDLTREAQILAKINHPNVVSVLDIVEQTDSIALVMEYLPGKTLANALLETRPTLEKALQYGIEIAKGLDAIHQAGLVHQDIKPSNIFFDTNQQLKIGDFGIAQTLTHDTEKIDSLSVGSFYSLSPEQIAQQEVTAASDIYSLGILMFDLIAGVHPFAHAGDIANSLAERTTNPAPQLRSNYSAVNQLIMQMLERNPSKRPVSAAEIVQRIKTILTSDFNPLNQHTIEQNNPILISAQHTVSQRRKRVFWGSLVSVVVLIALTVWFQWPKQINYITVMPPEINQGLELPDIPLIQASVHQATVNVFQSIDTFKLVASSEVPDTLKNISDIQRITAAEHVLFTTLDCTLNACAVTFSFWEESPAILTRQEQIQVPTDRLLFVSDIVQEFLYKWVNASMTSSTVKGKNINEQEYRKFLALKNSYQTQSINADTYISALASLTDSSCQLEALCHALLLRYREQYFVTRDDVWLQKSRALLKDINDIQRKKRLMSAAAEIELAARNFDKAEEWLLLLENKDIVDDSVRSIRARWYFSQGLAEKAKALFSALVEDRPSTQHLYNYALMLFRSGETDKSLSILTRLLTRAPEHVKGLELQGIARYYTGDWNAVVASYQALIELNQGDNATTQSNLGFAFLMNGETDKALPHLQKAVEMAPNNPQILINLADSMLIQGDEAQSNILYQQVISQLLAIDKPSQNDLLTLAQAYAQLGQKNKALKVLIEAENKGANDPFTLYFLSLVYAILDENATAIAYKNRASEQGVPMSWFNIIWFESLTSSM